MFDSSIESITAIESEIKSVNVDVIGTLSSSNYWIQIIASYTSCDINVNIATNVSLYELYHWTYCIGVNILGLLC